MSSIRAIVVDPEVPGRLAIKEVEAPQAGPSEALVQVEAISLNRGEVLAAMQAEAGWRPGWDLAGTVIKQAANETGPKARSQVLGSVPTGSWAEQVAVPTNRLAELPASVMFAQAATIPTAGLTAFRALQRGGLLLNKHVLITGSTGGVGRFALQLARLSGAYVVGTVRHARHEAVVHEAEADEVIVGDDLAQAGTYGPYHLILDLFGVKKLESAIPLLATEGTCVIAGASASSSAIIDFGALIRTGRVTLYVLNMYAEFDRRPRSEDLAWLAQLVAEQQLQTSIETEASWHDIGEVAQRLLQRQFTGKAVLHLRREEREAQDMCKILRTFWLLTALVLWLIAIVPGFAVYTPTLSRQIRILAASGPESAEFRRLSTRGTVLGIILAVFVLTILVMMVFKLTL